MNTLKNYKLDIDIILKIMLNLLFASDMVCLIHLLVMKICQFKEIKLNLISKTLDLEVVVKFLNYILLILVLPENLPCNLKDLRKFI